MEELTLTPSEFVALLNQTLEYAYPFVVIEGELSNFRVSKNRWVYFDLKDDDASVQVFGSAYNLPGPLQDGLSVRVAGVPRLHPRFGFSVSFQSIVAVGEGSIKKAADLLQKKLEAEGLFDPARKRLLPAVPASIGLITADKSAAASDFLKIINERWGGVEITLADVLVQGDSAPLQIMMAIEHFNQLQEPPELLVLIRGGGSADDMAAFNDERVVRAVAASRVPTLVAIGHEVDVCLAELAADQRASTPTNAAQLAVPERRHELEILKARNRQLVKDLENLHSNLIEQARNNKNYLSSAVKSLLEQERQRLQANKGLMKLLDPKAALSRGYSIIKKDGKYIGKAAQLRAGDELELLFIDGKIRAKAEGNIDG